MPITQERFIRVLDEANALRDYARGLREDLIDIIDSDLPERLKHEAISALCETAPPPATAWIEVESEHFQRAYARNLKSRERLRQQRKGASNGPERTTTTE